jgi:hypothetical protein
MFANILGMVQSKTNSDGVKGFPKIEEVETADKEQ